ncbi:hypothetical protein O1611_g8283 [Lasiodiplodia mahajangana]|uniref:Uncharacterized protein n=1 Tax=Lasiodiplodia mahajangana TaxID=1108764 RepID=A0ACC2JD99_9PEZI|nr:hypothetical protein O1611_g8283 [Lasiodiplodia mahajangana]
MEERNIPGAPGLHDTGQSRGSTPPLHSRAASDNREPMNHSPTSTTNNTAAIIEFIQQMAPLDDRLREFREELWRLFLSPRSVGTGSEEILALGGLGLRWLAPNWPRRDADRNFPERLIPNGMMELTELDGSPAFSVGPKMPEEAVAFAYTETPDGYPQPSRDPLAGRYHKVMPNGAAPQHLKAGFTKFPFQGQIWIVNPMQYTRSVPPQFLMSPRQVALLESFYLPITQPSKPPPYWHTPWTNWRPQPFTSEFVTSYIDPSHPGPSPKAYNSDINLNNKWVVTVLQSRLRYFIPVNHPSSSAKIRNSAVEREFPRYGSVGKGQEAFILERQMAKLRKGDNFIYFCENVSSISLIIGNNTGNPYIIRVLTDISPSPFIDDTMWKANNLEPCGTQTGVTQFLAMLLLIIQVWGKGWMSTIDEIDSIVRVQLNDFLEEDNWTHLMFDNSFTLSKHYFSVLQILRIMDEWIERTDQDLKDLRAEFLLLPGVGDIPGKDLQVLDRNWDKVQAIIDKRIKAVRDRVARKVEEIKSLRDGLFNATSLRESTKGMALNRAIYVFTVITVIYTPVGFMAAFWALPFLNNAKDGVVPEPPAFRNTFIIIPILTYALAIAVAFIVGSETGRKLLKLKWER